MQKGNLSLLLFLTAAVVAIVVIVMAMGGVGNVPSPSPTPSDVKTQELMKQDTSDSAVAIEQDLKSTEFTGLDTELADIDREVSQ